MGGHGGSAIITTTEELDPVDGTMARVEESVPTRPARCMTPRENRERPVHIASSAAAEVQRALTRGEDTGRVLWEMAQNGVLDSEGLQAVRTKPPAELALMTKACPAKLLHQPPRILFSIGDILSIDSGTTGGGCVGVQKCRIVGHCRSREGGNPKKAVPQRL